MATAWKALSDKELIARARDGEERAFEELVRRYEQTVYGFSFKVCRDKAKAEETYQDTFISVFKNLGRFEGKSKFSTWLYTIVTNHCRMGHRMRKLDREMESLDEMPQPGEDGRIPAWTETPEATLLTKELRARLDEAILKLPMDYRVVFVLRDIEQQTAEETAKVLKLSVPAVKSRLRRARVFLREELRDMMVAD